MSVLFPSESESIGPPESHKSYPHMYNVIVAFSILPIPAWSIVSVCFSSDLMKRLCRNKPDGTSFGRKIGPEPQTTKATISASTVPLLVVTVYFVQ